MEVSNPEEAVAHAAKILKDQLSILSPLKKRRKKKRKRKS